MNIAAHVLINASVGYFLGLENEQLLIFTSSAVLIDFDHPLYYAMNVNRSLSGFGKWLKEEFISHNPHPFFLHYIELLLFLLLFSLVFDLPNITILAAGFLLHWLTDVVAYITYYRSFSPWLPYLTFTPSLFNFKE